MASAVSRKKKTKTENEKREGRGKLYNLTNGFVEVWRHHVTEFVP